MGYIGRKLRESRLLFPNSNKGLIVPIDHGLTMKPIPSLQNIYAVEPWINNNYVSAILAHKGVLEKLILRGAFRPSIGVILHINGMPIISASPDTKILGEKTADKILIDNTKVAISAGASRLCVGRNVFQNLNPQSLLKNLYECINAELISLA
ncbi:hypothetical protein [Photorhabdus sp. RM323S]|uniref:hypothetical protein n=1 Tax=Photorhabdus sp. RM323S TaxID=3342828 RepID=UPI0036DD2B36